MASYVILVSPPGQRLRLDMATGTIRSVQGEPDDDYTYVVVEAPPRRPPEPEAAAPPMAALRRRRRPIDVGMTWLAGRPVRTPDQHFEIHSGAITLEAVATRLADDPEGPTLVITLDG